jgi:transposase
MLSIGMLGRTFRLSRPEAQELRTRVRARVLRAGDVRRARVILMLSEGQSWSAIEQALGCSSAYIARWQARFARQRLAGLFARHQGRPVSKRTPRLEARILAWTRRPPDDGSTHWSSRKLARALGINHMMVARVWRRAGLKPHRLERYMASDDPDFERKAADVIGRYVNPPQHAAVFCVDEQTAIQALDRLDPVLPLSPGRAERHGFEYYRPGTLSLYAARNTKSGKVLGQTAAHHTTEEFVAFLGQIVALQPRGREIHIIADNLSAHKTKRSHSSWPNIPSCTCILLRPIPRGSISSNSGSAASNAMSSLAGSSPRSRTWRASSCVTSVITTNTPRPSNGPTATSRTESSLLPIHLLQATSEHTSSPLRRERSQIYSSHQPASPPIRQKQKHDEKAKS